MNANSRLTVEVSMRSRQYNYGRGSVSLLKFNIIRKFSGVKP